jgi:hypothetical protein
VHFATNFLIFPPKFAQATDADEGLNGEVRYHILQKPDDHEQKRFDVHPITGQVRGITSFTRDAGKVFGFDVRARDRRGAADGHSVIANVIVSILLISSRLGD